MYKAKDKEGKEKRREEAGGVGEVLIGRGSGNSGANRQTVQMGLPGKVCGLCQICNWARTVTKSMNFSIFLEEEETIFSSV